MTCGIYSITNKLNGKVYIGKSVNIHKRWENHINRSVQDNPKCVIHKAIKKYGVNNFIFEIVEVTESVELINEREIYWIDHYQTYLKARGYNRTMGGDGGKLTEESLGQMTQTMKEKYSIVTQVEKRLKWRNVNQEKYEDNF